MGTIIAVANQKGGVGKTTCAANLSAVLLASGHRVLLLDCDPHCSLSVALGVSLDRSGFSSKDLFLSPSGWENLELPQPLPNLTVIPSTPQLAIIEPSLYLNPAKEFLLKDAVAPFAADFDFVVIDTPPTLGIVTQSAMVAADYLLVPMACDYLTMTGVVLILNALAQIQQAFNSRLALLGILLTMYDPRTVHSQQVVEMMRSQYGRKVLQTVIRHSAYVKTAAVNEAPVVVMAPHSGVAEDYRAFTQEVLSRVRTKT